MKNSILFLLLLISTISFAQDDTNEKPSLGNNNSLKNVVYVNFGSSFLYNAIDVNYDRLLWQPQKGFFKNYYLNVGIGVFSLNSLYSGPDANGVIGNVGIVGLTGKSKKHFEFGLSAATNIITKITSDDDNEDSKNEVFIFPEVSIGYRYQEKGYVFRTGIGFVTLLYIGFGFNF